MDRRTFRITTLGCRVNHAEARELASVLLAKGLARADQGCPADYEVIHTCSVTHAAVRKSRHAVRRARKSSETTPTPEVLVTGCFTTTDADEARSLAKSSANVIPHHAEDGSTLVERFSRRMETLLSKRGGVSHVRHPIRKDQLNGSGRHVGRVRSLPVFPTSPGAGGHLRAELKVQDGCDAHCTFCIIPRIRRILRSKSIPDAVAEATRLVELGHREVVLTGIFLGAYGHETALRRKQVDPDREHLADLLHAVAQIPGLDRLRLSSMEPGDATETLLDAMVANAPVVVPHLHLPLQSGSDRILRRMNRQYRVGEYLDMIDRVNDALTQMPSPERKPLPPAITTDIICGFPGESEDDFAATVEVAMRIGYLHMHVFPFSPRAGTAAARWTNQFVPDQVRKERVRRLIDLEEDPRVGLSLRYRRRLLDRAVRVLIEQPDPDDPSIMTGRCDQYALVHMKTTKPRGSLVHARILEVTSERTIGEIVSSPVRLTVLR